LQIGVGLLVLAMTLAVVATAINQWPVEFGLSLERTMGALALRGVR